MTTELSRRSFLGRCAATGLGIAVAGVLEGGRPRSALLARLLVTGYGDPVPPRAHRMFADIRAPAYVLANTGPWGPPSRWR